MKQSDRKHLEDQLATMLGRACEAAREELDGFQWVTHVLDYNDVQHSIQVVWVFDTNANLAAALRAGHDAYLSHLTAEALDAAGLSIGDVRQHVGFDSEEECARAHGGDWQIRLTEEPGRLH
ncbi:hypothetical protein [Aquisalimonas asiatica]|uniref:Uncharacterized protein n=1 Tax=Aquisalimonas asiatica TaxID=406100 RepID=A0A1H8ULX4_9GAMM|nr:hypothetical protein [Aquisalimonas asiatica]SEP04151.1 hypothetical protein SAMN04488052_10782 [Aquisalimonas asiatica]